VRLYDGVAALPNGQAPISGVGSGMVCMACHNTRNGETDDSTAGSLSGTAALGRGPHDGPQTDVLFGVNAYFVPLSNPSPHLAVQDTCVGCHSAIPTAAEADAGQTANHAFKTDLTICGRCHSNGQGGGLVDGAALQADVKAQMQKLDTLVFAKSADAMAAAVTANGSYIAQALDTKTGNYLCAAAGSGVPTIKLMVAPAPGSITEPQPVAEWRSLNTLWFPLPSLANNPECSASGALAPSTYDGAAPLQVPLASVKTGTPAAPIFVANGVIAKAISNEALLHDDQTWGIHNFPFFQTVIAATTTQLEALP
jgi:hypothetical protein